MNRRYTSELVRQSAQRAVNAATRERQIAAETAIEYYEDYAAMEADLTDVYKRVHDDKEKWIARPKVCLKILSPIVTTLCGLYRESPVYSFPEGEEKWAEMFAEWKDEHWAAMADTDVYTLVSGVSAVRPLVEPGGDLELALYTGDQMDYDPAPGRPAQMSRLILSFRSSLDEEMGLVEQLWTADRYERLVNGEPAYTDEEKKAYPGGRHKYGCIPHTLFHNSRPRFSLMGEPLTDLVAVNRAVNKQMTDHHWRMLLSGSILYTKGYTSELGPAVGAGSWVSLAEGGDVGFIEGSAQVGDLVESINLYLRMFFLSRRIPENAVAAAQSGESGIKIIADQTALGDYRKDRAALFGPWERELIRKELFIFALHSGMSPRWEDVPAPDIAYQLPQEPMSMERRSDWDRAIRLGLATAVDEMIARNPSMSREDALAKLQANLAQTRELMTLAIPDMAQGDESVTFDDDDGDPDAT